jgi:hypothetical protein
MDGMRVGDELLKVAPVESRADLAEIGGGLYLPRVQVIVAGSATKFPSKNEAGLLFVQRMILMKTRNDGRSGHPSDGKSQQEERSSKKHNLQGLYPKKYAMLKRPRERFSVCESQPIFTNLSRAVFRGK